ncbi:hypothetical protein D3C71_1863080 [compost metagenome]
MAAVSKPSSSTMQKHSAKVIHWNRENGWRLMNSCTSTDGLVMVVISMLRLDSKPLYGGLAGVLRLPAAAWRRDHPLLLLY